MPSTPRLIRPKVAVIGSGTTTRSAIGSNANAEMPDLTLREGLVLLPFIAAIVFMGVYPKPVIDRMEPAVDALIAHVEEHVEDFEEPTADVVIANDGGSDSHSDSHNEESEDGH